MLPSITILNVKQLAPLPKGRLLGRTSAPWTGYVHKCIVLYKNVRLATQANFKLLGRASAEDFLAFWPIQAVFALFRTFLCFLSNICLE